jgi:anti-sigma factor RsiW
MTHPKREEWVPYVFGEASPEERQRLAAHLNDCPECLAEIDAWQRSLGRLDAWELPARPAPRRALPAFLKWAAAAAILLGAGIGIGRLTAPAPVDTAALRAQIESSTRQSLAGQVESLVDARVALQIETALAGASDADRRFALALFEQAQRDRAADYVSLRKDLETMATFTEDEILRARRSIIQLSNFARPVSHVRPE